MRILLSKIISQLLKSGNSYKVKKYMNCNENEVFMLYNV